ncbi:hypothetical protein KLP28_06005 [Nocardioidaceae bacterium]|nr:hypothetical protein KLP28_06005 [Nocardioidaceae bacterium]
MKNSVLRTATAALICAASLALGAAPAHAETFDHDDATGDVRSVDDTGDDADDTQPEPLEDRADIVQLRVRHGIARLIMRVEVADLTRRDTAFLGPVFDIRTPQRRYTVDLTALNLRGGAVRDVSLFGPRGSVRCRGIFADLDFTGDVAMVSVPRRCIGSPRRVEIGAGMVQMLRDGERILADDAQRDGTIRNQLTLSAPIRSGPRRAA